MIFWIAGAIFLVGGWPVLRWSLPSVAFLFFMIPLPYRYEQEWSLPLQAIATKMSCWTLQSLGQPAIWQAMFPNCNILCSNDINGDLSVNGGDIDPFFAALGGNGPCLSGGAGPAPIPPPARDRKVTDFNRPANPPANDIE